MRHRWNETKNKITPDAALQIRALHTMSACVDDVTKWFIWNRVKVNTAKNIFQYFCRPWEPIVPPLPLQTAGGLLQPTNRARNLGVLFDDHLTWDGHVAAVRSVCFYRLRQIALVRRCLPQWAAKSLVQALVLPCLDYGSSLLSGTTAGTMDALQQVLNAASRLTVGAKRTQRTSPILKQLGWLPVPARITFRVATLVYKCIHGLAPDYLTKLIRVRTGRSGMRRSQASLIVPIVRNDKFRCASFSIAAPAIWNSLPVTIQDVRPDLKSFKRLLKSHLLADL